MAQTGQTGSGGAVLRRKAGAGRPAQGDLPAGPERALRRALARAGQEVPGLDLSVGDVADHRRALAELLDLLPDHALLAVIEGPEEGLGLVVLSAPVLAGIVEMLTTGHLAKDDRPARKPTRTDAAMTAGQIDRMLQELEEELSETPDLVWAGGFRFASFLDDPRPLGLLLEDVSYRVFTAGVSLGRGARHGEIVLVFPAEGRGPMPRRAGAEAPAPEEDRGHAWAQALEQAVMSTQADLAAVLHRMRVPLSAVLGFKPGDQIPVPSAQLDRIALEALDGRRVASGRLGQNRGMRAVRLTQSQAGRDEDSGQAPSALTAPRAGRPADAAPQPGAMPPDPGTPDPGLHDVAALDLAAMDLPALDFDLPQIDPLDPLADLAGPLPIAISG